MSPGSVGGSLGACEGSLGASRGSLGLLGEASGGLRLVQGAQSGISEPPRVPSGLRTKTRRGPRERLWAAQSRSGRPRSNFENVEKPLVFICFFEGAKGARTFREGKRVMEKIGFC